MKDRNILIKKIISNSKNRTRGIYRSKQVDNKRFEKLEKVAQLVDQNKLDQ